MRTSNTLLHFAINQTESQDGWFNADGHERLRLVRRRQRRRGGGGRYFANNDLE
jgi:hypothetical protein